MSDSRRGLAYGFSAYFMWGLFPLYWPLLHHAQPVEILSHRIVWTLAFVAILLTVRRRWAWLGALRGDRVAVRRLVMAAVVVSINWGLYIWGVNHHHVIETSLGYFINPLVTVLLGVVVLGERLRPVQWAAVGIGALAVAVLTVDYGRPPWLALTLAFSFGFYGLLKKRATIRPLESLAVEAAVLAPLALAWLVWLDLSGHAPVGRLSPGEDLLLLGTGVVTALPLICFGAAAQLVPLSTIGLLQYLAPVLQLSVGVFVQHEAMPASRLMGFALVWLALAILAIEGLSQRRRPVLVAEPA